MVDPKVRKERLTREHLAMQRIRCEAIDFDAEPATAPERYRVRFRLRSLLGAMAGQPTYTPEGHVHQIEIQLPASYPERLTNEDVRFRSAPIFHPNVFVDGRVCIRDFQPSESLPQFVLRLARYIQCDPSYTGLDSPANLAAKDFFAAHPQLFPTDRTRLPDGEGAKVFRQRDPETPVKKTFVVGSRPAVVQPRRRFVVGSAAASRENGV